MDMKYYIAVLCAATIVVGSLVGTYASAEDAAEIDKITKTVSMDKIAELMEARGFEVAAEDDVISAYKEGYGRTIQITVDCPAGECQVPPPAEGLKPCGGFGKKNFRFKMHGVMTVEAIKEKMAGMGYNVTGMEGKINMMQHMRQNGYKGCPSQAANGQDASE
ncbi:MAG: hypothetical protein JXC85_04125 [Candidatus Aenigmarchaeota archaeon]|nr:hypothetical protein [Candidatus Aenigmarchaeota archaeon]